MDPIFFTFIKNLPPKEKTIYLLIRAYEKELHTIHDQCSLTLIRDIYEPQIHAIINTHFEEPKLIMDTIVHHKDTNNKDHKGKNNDPFEDKLGKWVSDFSEDDIEHLLEQEEQI